MNNTIFDDVFRTMIEKMLYLAVPLINEVFHTSYPEDVKIADYIFRKEEDVRKGIGDIMGGKVLELESERLKAEGMIAGARSSRYIRYRMYPSQNSGRAAFPHPALYETHYSTIIRKY